MKKHYLLIMICVFSTSIEASQGTHNQPGAHSLDIKDQHERVIPMPLKLSSAIKNADLKAINSNLKENPNHIKSRVVPFNCVGGDGTVLHVAINNLFKSSSLVPVVECLLSKEGIEVDAKDALKRTPLMAIYHDIKYGNYMRFGNEKPEQTKRNMLHVASCLIKNGANVDQIVEHDKKSLPLIDYALDDCNGVELLLKSKAKVNENTIKMAQEKLSFLKQMNFNDEVQKQEKIVSLLINHLQDCKRSKNTP